MQISNKLQDEKNKNSLWRYITAFLKLLTPFRVCVGCCCLSMSILIIYSILITSIDRLINSECGFSCGYMLEKSPKYFNPLDAILLKLSSYHERIFNIQLFLLDTFLFAIILLYTFICVLYGVIKLGINLFSLEIYRINKRNTIP
jgi:LMBR1 domain-containing protein 1